jgi:anti-anti-sigma factor
MFVNFEQEGRIMIARIVGPNIGQREAGIISEEFVKALSEDTNSTHMHVDMSEVAFLNSMGIGMLVDLRGKIAVRKNMKLVLGGVKPELEQLLKMVRLDKLFSICSDEASLKKALSR